MQNEELTTESINTEAQEVKKNGVLDEAKIAQVRQELEDHQKDLKDKVYAVPVETEEMLEHIRNYINFDCEWKGMEAYGIKKVSEALHGQKIKSDCIFLPSLVVQGLAFFLMRNTGKGSQSADKMIQMNDIIDSAMRQIDADNKKLNTLQMNLAALEQGINISGEEVDESLDESTEPAA